MPERWFRQAVIYCLDVDTFQDSDGDGIGDLPGLIDRLDHLARLGVTCIWLNPIHPSPDRDDGYDITDFYGVHPRLGTLGDFVELIHQAEQPGHPGDHRPRRQPHLRRAPVVPVGAPRSATRRTATGTCGRRSEPTDLRQGMVFPGYQDDDVDLRRARPARGTTTASTTSSPTSTWTNPAVRQEIEKIIGFWLQLGVAGFRLDAAPFVIELTAPGRPERRARTSRGSTTSATSSSWRRGDAVILAEANVEPDELLEYFGDGHRLPMLFNFILNQRTFLALARQRGRRRSCRRWPRRPALPDTCQWATFLRNHDEVDLGRLVGHEHEEVFAAFGPEPDMQLYGRGIRRRLAPMLGNDRRRIEMAYALQFSLPGTPVIRYGDEIGMGEDLRLPERNAIRTPMQWSDGAARRVLHRPAQARPAPAGDHRRRVRLRDGQRRGPAARPGLAARAGSSGRCSPARVPGVRRRRRARTSTPATAPCSRSCTTRRAARCSPSTNLGRRGVTVDLGPQADAGRATRSRCSPTATTRRSAQTSTASRSAPTAIAGSGCGGAIGARCRIRPTSRRSRGLTRAASRPVAPITQSA